MKPLTISSLLAGTAVLALVALPAQAQIYPPASSPDNPQPHPAAMPPAPSVTAHLQMQAGQIASLGRLYDDYAARRMQQENKIVQWQTQLRQAQSPTSFDQNQAARLIQKINKAQQNITSDFLATRGKALKVLTPVQRAQLESIATDSRLNIQHDRFYELLLLPVEHLWARPFAQGNEPPMYGQRFPQEHREPRSRDQGSGSYGVYGGYSYGYPDYGVYGNYGQGGVGVHVGVGRGGPSIGIGIGRVFDGVFGRRYLR